MAGKLSKEAIARLVKQGRAAKGYTQQEVADMTQISLRSVQRIENAEVLPRLYTLRMLAEHLGFQTDLDVTESVDQPVRPGLNKAHKLILSISLFVLLPLLAGAYLFQSRWHPETQFEWAVLFAVLVIVYVLILLWIWR
jgi:transcriptional regulator with XRE-family HTH domain